jgi:hypothetical protein
MYHATFLIFTSDGSLAQKWTAMLLAAYGAALLIGSRELANVHVQTYG